ncbi:MAG: M48 family metalloprotease, partial [Candidatus Theseobacter exili]|nr:M48 family metalloprotease [Candidatus Theseobacter exili]
MEKAINTNAGQKYNSEDKTRQYVRIRRILFLIQLVLTFLFLIIIYASGFSCWLRTYLSGTFSNWALLASFYVICFYLVYSALFFPLSFYSGYVLERRFDLGRQSFTGWLGDFGKAEILSLVFCVLAGLVVYGLLRACPNLWWMWTGVCWLAFSVVLGKVFPVWILPLFYKIKPLSNKNLAERLLNLSKENGVRVLGVYEMDLSRKTRKANAMFAGLGSTKRIILGDTLVSGFESDEIEVVLAHELGHYRFRHLIKLFIVS